MILTESVRDAADLYLSLRYQPTTFICDTACTFVRHINLREPAMARKIWGDKNGCFEKPDEKTKPHSVEFFLLTYIIPFLGMEA